MSTVVVDHPASGSGTRLSRDLIRALIFDQVRQFIAEKTPFSVGIGEEAYPAKTHVVSEEGWRDCDKVLRTYFRSDEPSPMQLTAPTPSPVWVGTVNVAAIELLDSWCTPDSQQEQEETWAFLRKALEEDRLSQRKLFK